MARFGQTNIGSPEYSVHSASSHTTPTHATPRVPLLQRRITNPTSDQTPGPAAIPAGSSHQITGQSDEPGKYCTKATTSPVEKDPATDAGSVLSHSAQPEICNFLINAIRSQIPY